MSKPKWETPVNITTKQYFKTPFLNPHEGFVRLVRELEKELGKDKAHQMVAKVRDDCARDFAEKMGGGKRFASFEDFLNNYIPAINNNMYANNNEDGIIEKSPDCAMKAVYPNCVFTEIYEEWDALDIGYLWNCMGDYAMINAYCKQAGFDRPECLMLGDPSCTFCFKWEET